MLTFVRFGDVHPADCTGAVQMEECLRKTVLSPAQRFCACGEDAGERGVFNLFVAKWPKEGDKQAKLVSIFGWEGQPGGYEPGVTIILLGGRGSCYCKGRAEIDLGWQHRRDFHHLGSLFQIANRAALELWIKTANQPQPIGSGIGSDAVNCRCCGEQLSIHARDRYLLRRWAVEKLLGGGSLATGNSVWDHILLPFAEHGGDLCYNCANLLRALFRPTQGYAVMDIATMMSSKKTPGRGYKGVR